MMSTVNKSDYLDFSVKLFDIKPVFGYKEFIKSFVIGILIVIFVFELIRRCFYYIALGAIRPKK